MTVAGQSPFVRTGPGQYPRQVLADAGFQLWLANVGVGTVLGTAWLFRLPEDLSVWIRMYLGLALVSSVTLLALIPGALFLVVQRWVPSWRWVGFLQANLGMLFLALLYTDTIVYRLLRYHFNGAVLNVAITEGAGDAIHLGWSVWGTVLFWVVVGTALELGAWRASLAWMERRARRGRPAPLWLRPRVVFLAFLLPVVGIEKSIFAGALLRGHREVAVASRPLPLYPGAGLGRLLDPRGQRLPGLEVAPVGSSLRYPLAPPVIPEDGERPNLMVLVLDSWRRDMFTPELTPNLSAFASGGRVFEDHVSGGNGTRYGLFTLLYGLHGSYWSKVLAERATPVLVDTLMELGYDVRVLSAASMNFPELRDTAWAGLPAECVVDEFKDRRGRERSSVSYVKDGFVADAFEAWMGTRRRARERRPFFAFVLLDAPHQPYYNPGGPHHPTVDRLDYVELGRTTGGPELEALVERVFNTYKNSVLCADRTAGRLLAALEESGELQETLVLVTGDHGEEFQENGYWGHTSNFSTEQVAVPFYLRGPGVEPGVEGRPTSHVDVPNSLLELLGADPARRADYGLGESLFDPPAERARVVAGWGDLGVWTADGIFHIPLDRDAQGIDVYDEGWRLQGDLERRCRAQMAALERTARDCVRFLSPPVR